MSDNSIIASVPQEADNLALHVQLCEQRYMQLISKFDSVDTRFEKIETMLVDIKSNIKSETTEKYLKWAGSIIFVLSTALIGLLTHLLFR